MTFKRDVEQAIGFFRYDTDTWRDVFERANKEGGMDNKKIINVLICILEELDAKKDENPFKEAPEARPIKVASPRENSNTKQQVSGTTKGTGTKASDRTKNSSK